MRSTRAQIRDLGGLRGSEKLEVSLPSKLGEGEGAIIMVQRFVWCESGRSDEE